METSETVKKDEVDEEIARCQALIEVMIEEAKMLRDNFIEAKEQVDKFSDILTRYLAGDPSKKAETLYQWQIDIEHEMEQAIKDPE